MLYRNFEGKFLPIKSFTGGRYKLPNIATVVENTFFIAFKRQFRIYTMNADEVF